MQEAMATRIQSQSESVLIPRAVQRRNTLIDKANWGEMRVKEKKRAKSMGKSVKGKSRYSQVKAEKTE